MISSGRKFWAGRLVAAFFEFGDGDPPFVSNVACSAVMRIVFMVLAKTMVEERWLFCGVS
jgi:hypothetical protein